MEGAVSREWFELLSRAAGPLTFRLILQPAVAVTIAFRAGLQDARASRTIYFWTILLDRTQRRPLLRQGCTDVGVLFLVAIVLDVIYSIVVLGWIYPEQTLIVAVGLAIVPYLVVRSLTHRAASAILRAPRTNRHESADMDQEVVPQIAPPPLDQMQLAIERTLLAHERTLMAWIRTATSLITFGFALYKFFFYLREEVGEHPTPQILGARGFGLLLIGIGLSALALATWQHREQTKRLRSLLPETPFSLSLVMAALISVVGILAFVAALVRL